jgi:hypothetical protein
MTQRVSASGKTTKQGRRKGATSRAASRRTRERSPKAAELKKQLAEALQRQAASAEVLKIISSSPGDMKPVFEAMLVNALRICDAKFGHILLYDGERFDAVHLYDVPPSYRRFWEKHGPITPDPNTALGRCGQSKLYISRISKPNLHTLNVSPCVSSPSSRQERDPSLAYQCSNKTCW